MSTTTGLGNFRILWLLVIAAIAVNTGCDPQLAPGDVVKITRTVDFYFRGGIVPDDIQRILLRASWLVPEGLILEHSDLIIKPAKVEWVEHDGHVNSTNGLNIVATVSIRVTDKCTPGNKKISFKLPSLLVVASAINSWPVFPDRQSSRISFISPDTIEFSVFVYASRFQKFASLSFIVVNLVISGVISGFITYKIYEDDEDPGLAGAVVFFLVLALIFGLLGLIIGGIFKLLGVSLQLFKA